MIKNRSKKAIQEARDRAKKVFVETFDDIPVSKIAKDLHMSRQSLFKWKKEDNWEGDKEVYWATIKKSEDVNQKTAQFYIECNNKHLEEDAELILLLKNELRRLIKKPNKTARTLSYIVKAFSELRSLEISVFGKPTVETQQTTEYLVEWTGRIDEDIESFVEEDGIDDEFSETED